MAQGSTGSTSTPEVTPAHQLYEAGKERRYDLLFKVSGGAYTVAAIFSDQAKLAVLGDLKLWQLSVGMIFFTLIMGYDIKSFGEHMRDYYRIDVFRKEGQIVLSIIVLLIILGWIFVSGLLLFFK